YFHLLLKTHGPHRWRAAESASAPYRAVRQICTLFYGIETHFARLPCPACTPNAKKLPGQDPEQISFSKPLYSSSAPGEGSHFITFSDTVLPVKGRRHPVIRMPHAPDHFPVFQDILRKGHAKIPGIPQMMKVRPGHLAHQGDL